MLRLLSFVSESCLKKKFAFLWSFYTYHTMKSDSSLKTKRSLPAGR